MSPPASPRTAANVDLPVKIEPDGSGSLAVP